MVKFTLDIDELSKKISVGTQQISHQAVSVAHAAASSFTAGLRTCEERNSANLSQFEIRVQDDSKENINEKSISNQNSLPLLPVSTTLFSLDLPNSQHVTTVWGEYNFHFSLKFETSGVTGGYIIATAQDEDGTPLPLRCRWKRKIAGTFLDIHQFYGTKYPISADDVGTRICIEAKPVHLREQPNTAYGEIGPFELDVATRRNLDNYLALGVTEFFVLKKSAKESDFFSSNNTSFDMKCKLSSEEIELIKPGLSKSEPLEYYSCKYGADYPFVEICLNDLTAFTIHFNAKEKVYLSAMSRNQRDLISLAIRCFQGRQYLTNSLLLQNISLNAGKQLKEVLYSQGLLSKSNSPSSTNSCNDSDHNISIDYFVLLQRLTSEINRTLSLADQSIKERDRVKSEKDALEDDIATTINAYQSVLDNSNLQLSSADKTISFTSYLKKDAAVEENENKCRLELEARAANYQLQVQKYLTELETLRKRVYELEENSTSSQKDSKLSSAASLSDITGYNKHETNSQKNTTSSQLEALQKKYNALKETYNKQILDIQELKRTIERNGKTMSSMQMNAKIDCQIQALKMENKTLADQVLKLKTAYNAAVEKTIGEDKNIMYNDTCSNTGLMTTRVAGSEQENLYIQIKDMQDELEKAKENLEKANININRQTNKIQALTRDLSKAHNQINQLVQYNKDSNQNDTISQQQIKELRLQIDNQSLNTKELDEARELIKKLQNDNERQKNIIEELQKENEIFRSRIRKMATLSSN